MGMRNPPIDWPDLVALGVVQSATVTSDGASIIVTPRPPKLVAKLLAAAMASQPPEGDRMAYLRHVRDLLIGLTDYTQAADSPLTAEQRAAWAIYRQALRDLPVNYSGDGPIPWPQSP